jgi:hypothetical protein
MSLHVTAHLYECRIWSTCSLCLTIISQSAHFEGLDAYAILKLFMLPFSSGAQLSRIMTLDLFGVDKDYLFRYKAGVEASTGPSLLAAAQRHMHLDQHKVS